MHFNVRTSDHLILSYGEPAGTPPAGAESVDVSGATLAQIIAAYTAPNGGVTLAANGTVTALPVAAPDPVMVAAQQEQAAAKADLNTQYATAMTRLDQIIAATTPTNPQVVAAIQDLARYVKVLARLNHAEFMGG